MDYKEDEFLLCELWVISSFWLYSKALLGKSFMVSGSSLPGMMGVFFCTSCFDHESEVPGILYKVRENHEKTRVKTSRKPL